MVYLAHMNRGRGQHKAPLGGYTIVETLIFLAVSAALFVAAMFLIGGQQNKAQFVNVVRDFETRLTDIANDVSTGYYETVPGMKCEFGPQGPTFLATGGDLGTNKGCIFVGKVVKFGSIYPTVESSKYTVLTMAGNRTTTLNGPTAVSSIGESLPKVIALPLPDITFETVNFGYGATIERVTYNNGSDAAGAIGFFTTFQGSPLKKDSGSRQVTTLPYNSVVFGDNATNTQNKLNNIMSVPIIGTDYSSSSLPTNPSGGVTVCIRSGGTKQYALIKLGVGGSNSTTVVSEIKSYSSDADICL